MVRPFFSIVTVVYNAEKVVAETAASLMEQEFRDFEWIVVDGGSSDGTLEAIRPFVVEGRDTVISEPDRGVYDAMNKGLRNARGTVVQFLNAGDRFADTQVLGTVATAFDDEIDAIYGDCILKISNGLEAFKPALNIKKKRYRRIPFCHQALFTKREVHLQHPFDLRFKIAADYASFATMHKKGSDIKYLSRILCVSSVEPDAISKAGQWRAAAECSQINREILNVGFLEEATCNQIKRLSLLGGDIIRSLPKSLYDRLPAAVRRRVF